MINNKLLLTFRIKYDIILNMKIGIDFYGTISNEPHRFKQRIKSLIAGGDTVVIVSAIHKKNLLVLAEHIKHIKLGSNVKVIPVFFEEYSEVPELKLKCCINNNIQMMIDDRLDTCQLLEQNNIKTIHYTGWSSMK